MLKIFMWIGFILLGLIGVLFAYAATLPDTFRVERSLSMKASRNKIIPLISDVKSLNVWNPFSTQDPNIKITYGTTTSGKGATYAWDSTGRAGKGDMTVTDVTASKVTMNLHMLKPMEANNTVEFSVQENGESTEVFWVLSGAYPLLNRAFGVVFNMDKMVGGEFDKGLAALKLLVEK